MITMLNNFLPGVRSLHKGEIFIGLVNILPAVILGFWAYYFLSQVFSVALLVAVLASNLYRSTYAKFWQGIKDRFFNDEISSADKSASQLAAIARPPNWWIPIVNWNWMLILAVVALLHMLGARTEVNVFALSDGFPVVMEFVHGLLNPDWSLVESAVTVYARQTVDVALLGSAIGFVLALPISFLCAQNLMSGSRIGVGCYFVCRLIMVVVRAMPTFLLGLIFVALVGLGPFPGVLAITVFSMGVMVKLFSEAIEAAEPGIAEAIYASGGGWLNMVVFGILPQVTPAIIAQLLYCIEINVHSATVLGLIGAEGIGLPIHEYLSALAYDRAAVFIFITILMTIVIDYGSAYVRKKII